MKEKEDPEFPLHLGADQQTPPGSVLLVIPINELPELGKGEKTALFELWAIPCKAGRLIGWDSLGIKCPNIPTRKDLGGISAGVAGKG